jgi:5'-3' exoribonuclease 2
VEKALYRKGQQKHKIDPTKSRALHGDIEPHDLFVMDSQLVPPFDAQGITEFEVTQDRSMRYVLPSPYTSFFLFPFFYLRDNSG